MDDDDETTQSRKRRHPFTALMLMSSRQARLKATFGGDTLLVRR